MIAMGRRLLGSICLAAVLGLAAGCDSGDRSARVPEGPIELGSVRQFSEFPLYWLGRSFDGLPLTEVEDPRKQLADTDPAHPRSVSFTYGTCEPPRDEGGCAAPLQVTTEVGARPERYDVPSQRIEVLGVPGRIIGGGELELYTGRHIIAIVGDDEGRLRDAVGALRRANPPGPPVERLAPPRFDIRPRR